MKCFYHSADLDGKCSAAIVLRKYLNIELHGINYGRPFPWESISPREFVIMVDFSLQPFSDMLRLHELTDALVWIDHHKTALAEAEKAGWIHPYEKPSTEHYRQVAGLRRNGIGACALTWEYLFPSTPAPLVVRLLAEYDVWNHTDPRTLPVQFGMGLYDCSPDSDNWLELLSDGPDVMSNRLTEIWTDGNTVMKYKNQQNALSAAALCFDAELDGLRLLCANAGPMNSQFFDSLWDATRYHAMCLFHWRPGIGQWTVSLYSTRADVDVSVVCKAHGGGGHKGAAGFQCAQPPFELTVKVNP